MSAGIDAYVAAQDFVKAEHIPLTNVKGQLSHVLGEFIALGMLYHAKRVENFMRRKVEKKWELEPVELCQKKTMVIVGFGDIGAACGRIVKAFGTKVIGVKKRPEVCTEEQRKGCDELLGVDQLDSVIGDADYVVGVLPKTKETMHFFDKDLFAKMKSSGVFMNIGRGPTVKESDLVDALKAKTIAGAVLDVYEVEPLSEDSELWDLPNLLMTPHCADQDPEFMDRCLDVVSENLALFKEGKPLLNVCDKNLGY